MPRVGPGTIGKNAFVAYDWLIHDADGQHVDDLRLQVGKDSASVLIFLGAGLSFGVGRFLGRASRISPRAAQAPSAAGAVRTPKVES